MAVPKKKVSRGRRDRRRFNASSGLSHTATVICPACNEPTRPHRVCACGYYKDVEVLRFPEPVKTTEE